jgi:hypothetical protein
LIVKLEIKIQFIFTPCHQYKKRANWILVIEDSGREYTAHGDKAAILHDYFCSLLGRTNEASAEFQFDKLYENELSQSEWQRLQSPITSEEILVVIVSWSNNKSRGPNDFSGEFYKCLKDLLLPDLLQVFNNVAA